MQYHTVNTITAKHGFFTRKGGVSSGIFSSLNCQLRKEDTVENVLTNRKIVLDSLGLENLTLGIQDHTNIALFVDSPIKNTVCDALVTSTPGLTIGILTADCCPILLEDKTKNTIAAIHAGWRSVITGIIENTLALMNNPQNICAALGPCLWQDNFEVKDDFVTLLKKHSPFDPMSFIHNNHFDLTSYVTHRLTQSGIVSIAPSPSDTYSNPDLYFSYRRSTHLKEPAFGCQLSVIGLAS